MSYNDFIAGYQDWKEAEGRKNGQGTLKDQSTQPSANGYQAFLSEYRRDMGLPEPQAARNPYAEALAPRTSASSSGSSVSAATAPRQEPQTLAEKTERAKAGAQYSNDWLKDLFGLRDIAERFGTEAGESLVKGADAVSRMVQKDASWGERAEAGFDLVKTGLKAGLKGATGGVTNLLDALTGREDAKEAAAAQLAADTTVDEYLGQNLTGVQQQAAIDLLNRYKAANPELWDADLEDLPEAQRAELAKYRQLDKQLGWMAQTADRLDKGARAVWNNLAATPDVLLETGKAAAMNLADNLRSTDWLAALGDAWAGAGYDNVQAMTDEEARRDAARRAEVAQRIQETGADRTMDLDTEGARRMQRAAELQQQAKQGLSGGAALGYDVGMAVADNLVTLPLAAIPGVGGGLVLGVQGAKAAAQEANDLAQRGISADEALLRGAVSGGIEAATEKIGLDNILDIVGKGGKAALNSLFKNGLQQLAKEGSSSAVGRAVAGVLSNMSAEALEETASYLANYAAAEAFGDPEASFSVEELAYSALIGGLSGGVLGGGANVLNAITGRGKTAGAQADQQQSTSEAASEAPGADTTSHQGGEPAGVDLTQLYPGAAPVEASVPTNTPQGVDGTGVDLTQLYPEAQQSAAEQRSQGEAGSGFDIRQLYPDREQPSAAASPSVLANDQVDALFPAEQRASLEQFAGSKGLRVQYINDPDSPVSGSIQGNTMTINLGNGSYALGTAIHEVGHAMKAGDGKAFAEFQDAVLRLADTDPGLRRVAAGIVDAYLGDTSPARASMLNEDGSINRAALNEEVALKLAEELVQDPEQLTRTVSQDRTLIARFLDFVRKIKNSVSIRFTGSQKAMLDEAERTLENMLRGQAGEVAGQRLSIEQDANGDPFVNITEDILEGVPEREKINTVKRVLRERFPDGFTWNGWKIGLTMPGINEFTRSRYTQRLRNQANHQMYNDKLRTAANLNEIVEIADNIRNETPNHPRNDNLRSFNRADVRIKVGENEYTAQVVTAILPSTKEIFYDIISLTPTKIRTSLKANQHTAYVVPSSAEMPSISSIAAPGGIVNTQEEPSGHKGSSAESGAQVPSGTSVKASENSIPNTDEKVNGRASLRTSGGVNLEGARTLDEYIARKYGPQPAAQAAPAAAVPASDAAPAAVTPTTAEETTPTLERTAKSQSIQRRQESQFVRELGDLFGIPKGESRARLRQLATQLADQRRTTGRIDPALADSIFEEAYRQGRVVEEQFYNDYKGLKDEMRTTAVTLDSESRNAAEYGDLRRSAMGRVLIVNEGGTPVDVRYAELSERYPSLFPDDIINPLEQLQQMVDVAASIRRHEVNLDSYLGEDAEIFRQDARLRFDEAVNELTEGVDKVRRLEEDTARQTAAKRPKKPKPMTTREVERLKNEAAKLSRKAERIMNSSALTEEDKKLVDNLLNGSTKLSSLNPNATPNFSEVKRVYEAKKAAQDILRPWKKYKSQIKQNRIAEAQDMLEGTEEWQDKSGGEFFAGLRMSAETATRNIRDVSRKSGEAGKTAARKMTEAFQDVSTHEADKIKWENRWRKDIKALGLNQHESAYTQILGELQGLQAAEDMGYPRSLAEIEALRKAEADLLEKHGQKIDRRKVERAIPVFQDFYKEALDMENEANVQNGYDPIPARKGYFPHFKVNEPDGLLSAIAAKFGVVTKDDALPTDIAGITFQFKPGRRWNPFAQQRQGFETAYDALTGFDRYIDVAGDVIFHTNDISLLREMENGLRYKYGDEGLRQKMDKIRADETLTDEEKQEQLSQVKGLGKTHLSTFVQWLNEYTNLLAGKKSFHDRPMEMDAGRSTYRTMNNLEGRVAANMVAFNPGSWLTNFIPIAQAVGQTSPRSLLQAGYDTVRSIVQDDGFAGQSVFLTNRRGSDPISLTPGKQFIRTLTSPMQLIDEFTSNVITRAKFKDNMRAGMDQSEALADADRFAANLMADRSKGALPTIFARRNPVTKMFTMFQVEVNNQFRYLFKDLPDDLKEEGAMALAAALLKFFVASYLFNDLYEMVVGRRPAFDPIDMVNEVIGDTTGYQLPNTFEEIGKAVSGTASGEDFTTERKGVEKAVAGLGGSIAEQTPFVGGVVGGGRLPLQSAVPDIWQMGSSLSRWVDGDLSKEKAFADVGDELEKPIYYLGFPVAGGQIKKMIEGASTIIGGGSYALNSEGEKQLQFAVEDPTAGDWLTALTFGKWALPGGREYVENFQKKNVGYTQAYEAGYSTSILDQLYPGSGKGAGQVDYATMLPEQENAAQVDSWLEKLFGQTGNKSVLPSNSTTGFTVDGEQVKLSGPEALEYARDRQTVGYEILSLFQTPESRPLDVQEQYAIYAQDYAAEVAKAEATGIPPAETGWVAKVQQLAGVSGTDVTDDLIDVLTARAIIANTQGRKQPNGKEIQGSRRRNVLEALRAEGYTTDEAIRLYEALA